MNRSAPHQGLHLDPVASVIIVFCGLGASLAFMGVMAFYLWWCSKADLSSDATGEGATVQTNEELQSKKALAKLRSIDYQSLVDLKGGKDNLECCAVCLVEFYPDADLGSSRRSSNAGDSDPSIRLLPMCGHYFHTACIEGWLGSYQSCPLCRTTLLSAEIPAGRITADQQQGLVEVVVASSDDARIVWGASASLRSSSRMQTSASGRVVPLDTELSGSRRVAVSPELARELGVATGD